MKKILLVLLCFVLWGCASKPDIQSKMDEVFAEDTSKKFFRKNNYSSYIDYYVPSDVHEIGVDTLSTTYEYSNARMIMNVNVAGIISAKYYPETVFLDEGIFDQARLVYQRTSEFLNANETYDVYRYMVYEYEDRYLACFLSRDLVFYGYCDGYDLAGMSTKILQMAKSANVKSEDVVINYSSKDVIDYEKKEVNLFETTMPVNGNINDFLITPTDSSVE